MQAFKSADKRRTGTIPIKSLRDILETIQKGPLTSQQFYLITADADVESSGVLEIGEYLSVCARPDSLLCQSPSRPRGGLPSSQGVTRILRSGAVHRDIIIMPGARFVQAHSLSHMPHDAAVLPGVEAPEGAQGKAHDKRGRGNADDCRRSRPRGT